MTYRSKSHDDSWTGGVFLFFLATALIITVLRFTGVIAFSYSEGERTGLVNKLSHKGWICKTWEGEMNMGGFRNSSSTDSDGNTTSSLVANVFEFTVQDPEIVQQIKEAMASSQIVTLEYDQQKLYNPCDSSTGYFITAVN